MQVTNSEKTDTKQSFRKSRVKAQKNALNKQSYIQSSSNLLRSQSLYRKYGPNLPTSLTHRVSIRPKAANLGDLMRL